MHSDQYKFHHLSLVTTIYVYYQFSMYTDTWWLISILFFMFIIVSFWVLYIWVSSNIAIIFLNHIYHTIKHCNQILNNYKIPSPAQCWCCLSVVCDPLRVWKSLPNSNWQFPKPETLLYTPVYFSWIDMKAPSFQWKFCFMVWNCTIQRSKYKRVIDTL